LLLFLLVSALILSTAYRILGKGLARWMALDDRSPTPAHVYQDGNDFEPARATYLFPQHFSAIAAAGPIVGPILAATYFGWLPAWLWILGGAILIGGIHDFVTLMASVRHGARSIAEVVRQYMNRRSYLLFLAFIWVSLIYVIIAFTDVTSAAFVQSSGSLDLRNEASGAAVATSSVLYLALAVIMGLSIRWGGMSPWAAKCVFVPLVFLAIGLGPAIPLDLSAFGLASPQTVWNYLLLGYCFFASLSPVWILLQPRGALGGYFLYMVLLAGVAGVVVGAFSGAFYVALPAVNSQVNVFTSSGDLPPIFPVLFITVACGACSGFHSIVASGTTSKQLARESDARPVAYGAMLMEAFFACLSLATVMIVAKAAGGPDAIFSGGIAQFIHVATLGWVPVHLAFQFALLCFATFIFDTLDACTRLARYVFVELTGWQSRAGHVTATAFSVLVPALFLSFPAQSVHGSAVPLWKIFWGLFGASNQLLAGLALLGATMWLRQTGRNVWVTLVPAVFMCLMSLWSLGLFLAQNLGRFGDEGILLEIQGVVALGLAGLAVWLLVEAGVVLGSPLQGSVAAPSPKEANSVHPKANPG
jgi:carbon starvation protein